MGLTDGFRVEKNLKATLLKKRVVFLLFIANFSTMGGGE